MKALHFLIPLWSALALAQQPPALTITISPQTSPYTLPKGLTLYSAKACSSSTQPRAISAGQVIQFAESSGISVQDPATIPLMVTSYVAHTWQGRLLAGTSYLGDGAAAGGAAEAALKTSQPKIGNAATWDLVAVIGATIGAGIPLAQKALQGDVSAQQATITSGVKAALIADYAEIWTVPAGGCAANTRRMFLGRGGAAVSKGVIP